MAHKEQHVTNNDTEVRSDNDHFLYKGRVLTADLDLLREAADESGNLEIGVIRARKERLIRKRVPGTRRAMMQLRGVFDGTSLVTVTLEDGVDPAEADLGSFWDNFYKKKLDSLPSIELVKQPRSDSPLRKRAHKALSKPKPKA
jgi:hypothetical protein